MLGCFSHLQNAVIGAIAAYSSLWLVTRLYKWLTGRIGMGNGDFKLFAALGAFFGWQALPFILLCACVVGLIFGITTLIIKKQHRHTPIAFGPYLAFAGCINLFWSQSFLLHTMI